ncbi:MAG: ECF-type sigma factor [Planctomycetota bacterium]|jgi:RNA polymerase sigma factor (TIGR02999 family)
MPTTTNAPGGRVRVGGAEGDPTTTNELITEVYEQLRGLAASYLSRDAVEPMLEPAVLVNEAYLRLAAQPSDKWKSREHFLAVAALAMRKALIDQARRRRTLKRGFGRSRVSLELVTRTGPRDVDILEVDDALKVLASINKRGSCAVVLRFFAGLTHDEIARVQGVSRKTVVNDWSQARNWLAEELAERAEPAPERGA